MFEDRLEIKLQADIDTLLRCQAETVGINLNLDTEKIETALIQSAKNHVNKVFDIYVVSDGDTYGTEIPAI